MAKSTRKSEFYPCVVFPARAPCSEKDVMPNMNKVLCSNKKYEPGDVQLKLFKSESDNHDQHIK